MPLTGLESHGGASEGLNEEWRQWKTRDFSLCFVCGSRPWGAAAFHLCLFILLLKCVKCSPVPASFFPYLSTSLQYHYDFISHNSEFISHNSDFFLWILSLHLTFVFLDGNKLIYMHPVSPGEKTLVISDVSLLRFQRNLSNVSNCAQICWLYSKVKRNSKMFQQMIWAALHIHCIALYSYCMMTSESLAETSPFFTLFRGVTENTISLGTVRFL